MKESNKTKVVLIVGILVVVGIILAKKLMGGNSALTDLGISNSGSGVRRYQNHYPYGY